MTRILVVDDDPALRWTTTRVLARAGYTVDAAETGEEGLRLAGEHKPDLALLDVVLPGIDGLETCRRIKSDPDLGSIYVLLLSARRIDTLEQAAGLELGADGYIIRPVSNRELLARVEAMLRLKRAEDSLRAQRVELARGKEALQWSEERFRAVFHQAGDGIALVDPQGIVIEWNQAMERITGQPATSVVGRPFWEVEIAADPAGETTPGRRAAVRDDVLRAIESGWADWPAETVERRHCHPDGSVRTLAVTFFRIETGRGFLLGNIVRDVTLRHQAETALAREAAINAAMAQVASALIHTDSIKEISERVLDHARHLTGSEDAFAGYIDPGGHLVVPALTGDVLERCHVAGGDLSFEHFHGLWGWVIEHRQPLLTNAPGDDPRSSGTPPGHIPIQRFLAVPAVVNEVLMGEIALANAGRDYTELDLELVQRLATLYALAIQRLRAEQALRDSELRFRSLLESAPDAVLLIDAQGRISFLNTLAESSFGYDLAELLGQPVVLLLPGYVPHAHARHLDGQPVDGSEQLVGAQQALSARRKDGILFPVDVNLSPAIIDAELVVTTIIRDVTEREEARAALQQAHDELEERVVARTAELAEANRDLHAEIGRRQEAEQALRASEARFRQIAAHIDEALWMADTETGEFLYVSPIFEEMALIPEGLPVADPRLLIELVHPEDRERVARALAGRDAGADLECRILRDDGSARWVRIRTFPIRDQAGHVYRIAGLAHDVTAARQAQAAMIQNERLAIAGKLAASLAHEINNPLQSAIGCLDLVQESLASGEDPAHFLSVVEEELERTARIVAQLRTLFRPSAPRDRQPTDLNALLDQVLLLAQKQLSSSGIHVARDFARDLPELPLSPDEMRQVLLNLVLNAVDAMPQGGELAATTARAEPDGVVVRLVDTGGGMTRDTLRQLFDPFYEYALLRHLMENSDRVVPPRELVEVVRHFRPDGVHEARDVIKWYVHRLRQKVERDPSRPEHVLNVRGAGYTFKA